MINQVAHQLLLNGKTNPPSIQKSKATHFITSSTDAIRKLFLLAEIVTCIKSLQNGKAAALGELTIEQIKKLSAVAHISHGY